MFPMPFYEILNFYHRAGLLVSHIHKPKITFSNRFQTDADSILLSTNQTATPTSVKTHLTSPESKTRTLSESTIVFSLCAIVNVVQS